MVVGSPVAGTVVGHEAATCGVVCADRPSAMREASMPKEYVALLGTEHLRLRMVLGNLGAHPLFPCVVTRHPVSPAVPVFVAPSEEVVAPAMAAGMIDQGASIFLDVLKGNPHRCQLHRRVHNDEVCVLVDGLFRAVHK